MRKLSTSKLSGKKQFFIDGVECTQFEWQQAFAQNKGYKNFYQYSKDRGYAAKQLKAPEQTFRIKDEHTDRPDGLHDIPGMPNYYATAEGQIWCWSTKRNRWINIAQQTQKSGYRVFQPFIDGIRRVRYCHIAIHNAYHGICPEGYEVHHIDGDNTNNHANNLMCMIKEEHRSMRRGKYNKNK